MNVAEPQPAEPKPRPRWYHPMPVWLIYGLAVVEGLLWLSERFQWPMWHKGYAVLTAVAIVGVGFAVMLLWFAVALFFRWRFQFSIRSLLVLTVAVAVPCSWLAAEIKEARDQKCEVDELVRLGGQVGYAGQVDEYGNPLKNPKLPGPILLRHLLGEDFFTEVVFVNLNFMTNVSEADLGRLRRLKQIKVLLLNFTHVSDDGMEQLESLKQLETLFLGQTRITDAGLGRLTGLTQLKRLDISFDGITDSGLKHLGSLTQLEELCLDDNHVTDAGLAHIAGLKRLQSLSLASNPITGAGLAHIEGFRQLRHLDLSNDKVTNAGVEHLSTLPQLKEIFLGNTLVTDFGLTYLRRLTSLQKIDLGFSHVTDEGVKESPAGNAKLRDFPLIRLIPIEIEGGIPVDKRPGTYRDVPKLDEAINPESCGPWDPLLGLVPHGRGDRSVWGDQVAGERAVEHLHV